MASRARERLVETAERLFYAEGIRAVGVDRLLQESGVGRASFYRHFSGKDELVVEVLERRDQAWRAWLAERVVAHGGGPLAVFDALEERFARADFRGCAFLNTMVESADPASAAHRVAAQHKRQVIAFLSDLLAPLGIDGQQAQSLAHRLMLLMDGAIVTAVREQSTQPAAHAREMAAVLIAGTAGPVDGAG
ncbi:TetR/AcrR family transcriptional regulator [Lysobacter korlensis]|uniref:TetR/AcrR family transcriptional regulator n=1 Tax=Lysobacter korlensis TaxID=553636 RepID=A0ABV6RWA0_9GAMM